MVAPAKSDLLLVQKNMFCLCCRILEEQDMELAGGGGPKASGYDADNLAGMKVSFPRPPPPPSS